MQHHHDLSVPATFRLDVTTAIVRRFTSAGDITEFHDGTFVCALPGQPEPSVVAISQPAPERLHVVVSTAGPAVEDRLAWIETILGLGYDDRVLRARVAHIGWLRDLVERFAGAWPACVPTVWEAP